MNDNKIRTAYKKSISIYDEILRGKTWWSKLYLNTFWGGYNDDDIAEELLSRIPVDFSGSILDIPVGTGIFTGKIYKKLQNASIIGVDYSADMLVKCRKLMDELEVDIKLRQGDVGDLEFKDNTFDMVLSMNGFHAFPNKESAFDSCKRVLKPGGIFLACFYIKNEIRISDFLVNNVLSPKGWFTPPFDTKETLINRLKADYDILWYSTDGAIISFECRKNDNSEMVG